MHMQITAGLRRLGHDAYYFETTPRGVRYEQANENVRYRPRWQASARITGGNWNAAIR